MTPFQSPDLETWRALYDAAIRFKNLAPWEWMDETDIFGVQDPESGRVGFVSIMGKLGEHFGLSAYLDAMALYQYWELAETPSLATPQKLLEIEQLTASFENREELTTKDRKVIKKLGLRFRGRKAWPLFRKIIPGYLPWHIEAHDARFLMHILEQAILVAQRTREEPELLYPDEDESIEYLIRVPRETEDGLVWEDAWREVPPPDEEFPIYMDFALLEHVRNLPRADATIEMDLFPLRSTVKDDEGRPFIPYMLMAVDRDSGMILEGRLLSPEPNLWEMQGRIPIYILETFAKLGAVPKQILIQSEFLEEFLEMLSEELPLNYQRKRSLRQLESARRALQEFLG